MKKYYVFTLNGLSKETKRFLMSIGMSVQNIGQLKVGSKVELNETQMIEMSLDSLNDFGDPKIIYEDVNFEDPQIRNGNIDYKDTDFVYWLLKSDQIGDYAKEKIEALIPVYQWINTLNDEEQGYIKTLLCWHNCGPTA